MNLRALAVALALLPCAAFAQQLSVAAPGAATGQCYMTNASGPPTFQPCPTSGVSIASSAPGMPGGRLTLDSGSPIQRSDFALAGTIYYLPFTGDDVPVYDGSSWQSESIGAGLSLPLDGTTTDPGYQAQGNLYDLYYANVGGALYFGAGPAWSGPTSRGTPAALTQSGALWTNAATITMRYGNATADTVSVPAGQGTYLGTMLASGNGQVSMVLIPSPATGGTNNVLGLWNAYNRAPVTAVCRDLKSTWLVSSQSQPNITTVLDGSPNNRITWIDGLQLSPVSASMSVAVSAYDTVAAAAYTPILALDNTSNGNPPTTVATQVGWWPSGNTNWGWYARSDRYTAPLLGLHYMQGMESAGGTVIVYGNGFSGEVLRLEM